MSRPTPGPWEIVAANGSLTTLYQIVGGNKIVVRTLRRPNDQKEIELANARLIAAAPQTAAECERLRAVNAELVAALEPFANFGAPFAEAPVHIDTHITMGSSMAHRQLTVKDVIDAHIAIEAAKKSP